MKLLLVILILFGCNVGAEEVIRAKPNVAGFPTRPGEYTHKQWKYVYEIQNPGTRSEIRIGKVFLEGKPVTGATGELLQELFGHFIYFGDRGWNRGWLNTLTYDRPVFDAEGNLTDDARALLPKSTETKKAEQSDAVNPHAFGTFGISPAEQARMPKASGDT